MEKALLLRGVTVIDPASPAHGTTLDIRCAGGRIEAMAPHLPDAGAEVWDVPGSFASPGWVDGQAHFRDPGHETMEGLESGLDAATAGGFSDVVLLPSTTPPLAHKSDLVYLQRRADGHVTRVHPMGLLSQDRAGERMADSFELAEAGAVAFFDDAPTRRPEMLRRGLEYTADLGRPVISQPVEGDLNSGAQMHEGVTSTQMGVMGTPAVAESMRMQRDLDVLRYAGGRLHFSLITTRRGVEILRAAKEEGLAVTGFTSAYHLWFCDADLLGFDGLLKVWPPFRSEDDRDALRAAVLDGSLDGVVSDHRPQDLEHHDTPFVQSPMGMAGNEAAFAVVNTALAPTNQRNLDRLTAIVRALTSGPRRVYGLPAASLQVGSPACLTWFETQSPWFGFRKTRAANLPGADHGADRWKGQALGVVTPSGWQRNG